MVSTSTYKTVTHRGVSYEIPTGLFINNEFVPSVSGKTFPGINPSTEEWIADIYEGDKADVDLAVKSASTAYKGQWSKLPGEHRGALLYKLATLVERDMKPLAAVESLQNGKPFKAALAIELPLVVSTLRYYAGWADKNHGKVIDALGPTVMSYTRHEPFGVVGQIIPWNYPLVMLAWKIAPALACGNTTIVKTSEKTPLSALKFAELIVEAGFPPGVVNIISGFGPTAGEAITRHPEIRKVAFTGSNAVGKRVAIAAAETNMKKVSLELGGKSPNIVFADADLDLAVSSAYMGIFFNAGQTCCAGSRVFVHEDIYDAFVAKFKAMAEGIKVGDPFAEDTDQGAIVDELQFKRILNYIDIGRKEGATVTCGGSRVGDKGYYIAPTLMTDVKDNMTIAKEEIFGPVVCVMKFKTTEEVIQRAHDTIFGLAAAVHTKDLKTAIQVSSALEAGTVWVNCYNVLTPQVPFGGFKQSGLGRELGEYGLHEYTQVKAVYINLQ